MLIKDIGKVVTGKTPPTENKDYYGGDILFITPNELHDNFHIKDSEKHLTDAGLNVIQSNSISGLSVLVGCIGWDMGNVAIVNKKCATNQQINSITEFKEDVNPYYVYYWLKGKKDYLFKIAKVTRTPILSKGDFENVDIPLPEKHIQDSVVNALVRIDELIEENREICSDLNNMAKLLYDYWFVQFDFPDDAGKPYKSSGGKMVWNDDIKREIPIGWEVKPLKNICTIVLGGTPKTEKAEYWNGIINWLNSGEVAQFPVVETELKITELGLDNSATTLMLSGTVVVSITGNLRISILAIDSCGNQSIVGILENNIYKKAYLYPVIENMLGIYNRISTGNCQQHISKGTIEDSFILCPPSQVLDLYYQKTDELYNRIVEIGLENHELASLRDFLLPILMNGQVKIRI